MADLVYSWEKAFRAWERLPVDDFEYLTADELLVMHPYQLKELADMAVVRRFDTTRWRNRANCLANFMNLENVGKKVVLDFGCGYGFDSIVFCRWGAVSVLADMHPKALQLAQTILDFTCGRIADKLLVVGPTPPYFEYKEGIDLFWSFGVLHHLPYADQVLLSACRQLKPGGECRVVVYSDKRWERLTKTKPDGTAPVWEHPKFSEFVGKCDAVGDYADWYDEEKLHDLVDGFAEVKECRYLCQDDMLGAVLSPKSEKKKETNSVKEGG